MAFRELLEEEVTKIKLALYKLYSSARIGESPDQKIDETFDDIMEIFYKSSMDFSFVDKLWADFNHVPKTVGYLVEFLKQNKDIKRIGNTFKTKFLKLFKEILIDCENGEVTLSLYGVEIPDYNINEYNKYNIPYWNKILEEALDLYDNHWFLSFIEPYASKCEFFMILPKHLENPKISRDNKALLKRILNNTKKVFFQTEKDNIRPLDIGLHSDFLYYCSSDIDIYTYLYNIRRDLILDVLRNTFVSFITKNEKCFKVFTSIYERCIKDEDDKKIISQILYSAIKEKCTKVIDYISKDITIDVKREFTRYFISGCNKNIDYKFMFQTYKIHLDIEEINSCKNLRYMSKLITLNATVPLRDIFGIDMTFQQYLEKYEWITKENCNEDVTL
jgi:hypothetical protein